MLMVILMSKDNAITSNSYDTAVKMTLGAAISAALFGISYCIYKGYKSLNSTSFNSKDSSSSIEKQELARLQGLISKLQAQVASQHQAIEIVSQALLSQGLKFGEIVAQQTQDEFGESLLPSLQVRMLEVSTAESLSSAIAVLDALGSSEDSREVLKEQRISFIQDYSAEILGNDGSAYPEGYTHEVYNSQQVSLN